MDPTGRHIRSNAATNTVFIENGMASRRADDMRSEKAVCARPQTRMHVESNADNYDYAYGSTHCLDARRLCEKSPVLWRTRETKRQWISEGATELEIPSIRNWYRPLRFTMLSAVYARCSLLSPGENNNNFRCEFSSVSFIIINMFGRICAPNHEAWIENGNIRTVRPLPLHVLCWLQFRFFFRVFAEAVSPRAGGVRWELCAVFVNSLFVVNGADTSGPKNGERESRVCTVLCNLIHHWPLFIVQFTCGAL